MNMHGTTTPLLIIRADCFILKICSL